jgi:PIN domain nuclease of toxin-antitoxin system
VIILDTHVWLWWINQDFTHLGDAWREALERADRIGVSAISCFEVAWLVHHGRIVLPEATDTWFEKALGGSGIDIAPITPAIAQRAVELPEHHRDPQDRLIIATAIVHDAQLLSADGKFTMYEELKGRMG